MLEKRFELLLRGCQKIEVTVWHYRLKTSLTLIRFYLIGYWRLKGNATSSTLCQRRKHVKHHSKIYKISQ